MKLATAAHLKSLTGKDTAPAQCEVLRSQLGVSPIVVNGKIRIYEEALLNAMTNKQKTIKPELKI